METAVVAPPPPPPTSIADCLRAFCACVSGGDESGDVFTNVRRETETFVTAGPWPEDGDQTVREYFSVPNHRFACTDLDYKRFTTTPLVVGGRQLHLHHILEIFSRTNPARYATVWRPLLDLAVALAPTPQDREALQRAQAHLQQQIRSGTTPGSGGGGGAIATTEDPQLDAMVSNVLGTFPGLQGIVQQIMTAGGGAGGGADEGGDAGVGGMMQRIQGMMGPLLQQAATTAGSQDPTLQPALSQIMMGFNSLTSALMQPPPATSGGGGGMDE